VVLAVEFLQNHLEVCAHRPEYLFQALEVRDAKDLPSPLGDKDQVCMQQINDVTALADFHELDHG
jgi:hypothetical protein